MTRTHSDWRNIAASQAIRYGLSSADVDDAASEAVYSVLRSPCQDEPYLFTVVTRTVRAYSKHLKQTQTLTVPLTDSYQDQSFVSLDYIEARERFDSLSPEDQWLIASDLHGYSDSEIAAELEITPKAAELRLRRLRKRLRDS